jgi:hypothetical protein
MGYIEAERFLRKTFPRNPAASKLGWKATGAGGLA